jgi:hypothetical protein
MRVVVVLVFFLILGCATQPVTIDKALAVPAARMLAPQWIAQLPYTGSLVVKRDSGFMGSACNIRVFIDTVPVADLAPSEKVELFVALGEHVVGAASTGMLCGGGASEAAVVVTPERQRILRIASGQSGDIHLQPSAF